MRTRRCKARAGVPAVLSITNNPLMCYVEILLLFFSKSNKSSEFRWRVENLFENTVRRARAFQHDFTWWIKLICFTESEKQIRIMWTPTHTQCKRIVLKLHSTVSQTQHIIILSSLIWIKCKECKTSGLWLELCKLLVCVCVRGRITYFVSDINWNGDMLKKGESTPHESSFLIFIVVIVVL